MVSTMKSDYLWKMLTSNQVIDIACSVFIAGNPRETQLPEEISFQVVSLLQNIKGHIYPIALRGKSQSGKSTTLNRIAKISNVSREHTQLPVGTTFGITCTYGIWLMIITFRNEDALLLFDMQGTDRGADEITHKLIAFTDHVCTKVVDVFRMPMEGFSNEYINALYCLSIARDSVENLVPTSDKAILWTDCVLPKTNPYNSEICCNTPQEYHAELLNSVVGERSFQAAKAKVYTENSPIFATKPPSREILQIISTLENEHEFIQNQIVPVIELIVQNVQPVRIQSHVITNGRSYVEYLINVYRNIQRNEIDLPFCDSILIRSVAISLLEEMRRRLRYDITEISSNRSNDIEWISQNLLSELKTKTSQYIEEYRTRLADLPNDRWSNQLNDLKEFATVEIRRALEKFRPQVIEAYITKKCLELNNYCSSNLRINDPNIELRMQLHGKVEEILQETVILFRRSEMDTNEVLTTEVESITNFERHSMRRALEEHCSLLCTTEQAVRDDWRNRIRNFEETTYSFDDLEIDQGIQTMIQNHITYADEQFSRFNIQSYLSFHVTERTASKDRIKRHSKEFLDTCKQTCIDNFRREIGRIIQMQINHSEKCAQLRSCMAQCLQEYHQELPPSLRNTMENRIEDILANELQRACRPFYRPTVFVLIIELFRRLFTVLRNIPFSVAKWIIALFTRLLMALRSSVQYISKYFIRRITSWFIDHFADLLTIIKRFIRRIANWIRSFFTATVLYIHRAVDLFIRRCDAYKSFFIFIAALIAGIAVIAIRVNGKIVIIIGLLVAIIYYVHDGRNRIKDRFSLLKNCIHCIVNWIIDHFVGLFTAVALYIQCVVNSIIRFLRAIILYIHGVANMIIWFFKAVVFYIHIVSDWTIGCLYILVSYFLTFIATIAIVAEAVLLAESILLLVFEFGNKQNVEAVTDSFAFVVLTYVIRFIAVIMVVAISKILVEAMCTDILTIDLVFLRRAVEGTMMESRTVMISEGLAVGLKRNIPVFAIGGAFVITTLLVGTVSRG